MSKQYVAVMTGKNITVHLPGAVAGADTLCGIDADDPHPSVNTKPAKVPRGARVNCCMCFEIWKLAKNYSRLEFDITE